MQSAFWSLLLSSRKQRPTKPYALRQRSPPRTRLLMESAMGETYKIKVIKADTDEVVKTLEAATERSAERAERGLSINLNHADYYTVIEPPKDTQ